MNILIGTDSEVFLKKDGVLVSAFDLVPGTKANPFKVGQGTLQHDGLAAEIGINPATTEEEWLYRIQDVMEELKTTIPSHEICIDSIAHFGTEFLSRQPEGATELGCERDYNAWSSNANVTPDADVPYRTGGGHIHIGWTNGEAESNRSMGEELVRQLDFFLGLPSLLFDADEKRRTLYGRAGAYRPKSYGVEYRTLSNQWLTSEKLMRLVYNNTKAAVDSLGKGVSMCKKYGDIQHIINNSNRNEAIGIMESAGICYE